MKHNAQYSWSGINQTKAEFIKSEIFLYNNRINFQSYMYNMFDILHNYGSHTKSRLDIRSRTKTLLEGRKVAKSYGELWKKINFKRSQTIIRRGGGANFEILSKIQVTDSLTFLFMAICKSKLAVS